MIGGFPWPKMHVGNPFEYLLSEVGSGKIKIFKHRRMIAAPTPGLIVRQFRLFINLKMLQ